MFRYLGDADENPFMMDPFSAHRQQMRTLFDPFGFEPFPLATQMHHPRRPIQPQATALSPFGMMGMGGGFMDMFDMMGGMMGNMGNMGNMDRMSGSPNCQTFSSSTVISYSSLDQGAPKVYQQTSEVRTAPGGIRETRQSMRDSDSGLERMSIGHHIGERAHVMERSRNRRTGDREDRQDFINLEETDVPAFDEEFRRGVGRYAPPGTRSIDYGRERRAAAAPQLALTAPPDSDSPPAPRHESPRHHQRPNSRPRYDW
ncbi:LOW QUALITY PROTEIN: myeloid leukemia factor 2 [Clupea harengus]|uniref:LOW QUALITY PROTEIN: myeloid leukemia factor 2 n=1 Tax=Clupea harengus TaxID=7950 RepID=A0A6P8FUA3_CLUHA|nr:LOW QUALITY PROTEIN: myeloid leukemia factor 2 [Clupea harengus]